MSYVLTGNDAVDRAARLRSIQETHAVADAFRAASRLEGSSVVRDAFYGGTSQIASGFGGSGPQAYGHPPMAGEFKDLLATALATSATPTSATSQPATARVESQIRGDAASGADMQALVPAEKSASGAGPALPPVEDSADNVEVMPLPREILGQGPLAFIPPEVMKNPHYVSPVFSGPTVGMENKTSVNLAQQETGQADMVGTFITAQQDRLHAQAVAVAQQLLHQGDLKDSARILRVSSPSEQANSTADSFDQL